MVNNWAQNKVILGPILQNLKGRSVLDKFCLKMILSTSQKRCRQAKSFIFSGRWSKKQNGDQIEFTPLSLSRLQNVPFKKGFKKARCTLPAFIFRAFIRTDLIRHGPNSALCLSGVNLKWPVVRFWDIPRMGSFGCLGRSPGYRRLSGVQGPQAPAGVKGEEPLCFVIAVNHRF